MKNYLICFLSICMLLFSPDPVSAYDYEPDPPTEINQLQMDTQEILWDAADYKGNKEGVGYFCPGCKVSHLVYTEKPNELGAQWRFNGDYEKPTFSPSILIKYSNGDICHSFVKEGKIIFLTDCTHDLAGQTVEMANYSPPMRC